MNIYRRKPSGLAPSDLTRAARAEPTGAAIAVASLIGGAGLAVLGVLLATIVGAIVTIAGLALMVSALRFARRSAALAIVKPALELESTEKWGADERSTWVVHSDESDAVVARMIEVLSAEFGVPLAAHIDPDGSEKPMAQDLKVIVEGLGDGRPVMALFALGQSGSAPRSGTVSARPGREGVWLRIDPQPDGSFSVVVVSTVGQIEERLCRSLAAPGN